MLTDGPNIGQVWGVRACPARPIRPIIATRMEVRLDSAWTWASAAASGSERLLRPVGKCVQFCLDLGQFSG